MKAPIILILILALIWSCASETEPELAMVVKSEMKMAEVSELARLMKKMHKDAKLWRKAVIDGQDINDSTDFYAAITTSQPTKSDIQDPAFHGMAKYYQENLDAFLNTEDVNLSTASYNNLISACITCHQSYCTGPIPTIKKLYIP